MVWAYGTLKYRQNEELMRRASVEVLERGLDEFVPQGVANMCWAFAKNDLIYEDFLEASASMCMFVAVPCASWYWLVLHLVQNMCCGCHMFVMTTCVYGNLCLPVHACCCKTEMKHMQLSITHRVIEE